MSYIDSVATTARTGFLDVAPLISALQFQPTDFELSRGWLTHVPSRHNFKFGKKGLVTIDARCDCSGRTIKPEQREQLFQAFTLWREQYWEPFEINREFASHFKKPNAWTRLFRDIRMAFRRFLRQIDPVILPADALAPSATEAVAAEQI